ncbi:DUF305 domain-containing protein [Blastococcus montanus]|uniref:DUF305 domain-containing protein n=1 Tax=Blastococcus montanus TaxID=3144973 RepID=UPI0032080223
MTDPTPARRSPLRVVLLAVIAVALVLLGGGLAVALGIGRDADPAADSVDAGFSRDMSLHHLQGVEMANLVDDRSDDPEVERLAFDISATQTNQAGRMQGWLSLWGIPPTGGEMMAWMGEDAHSGHDMGDMDADMGGLMPGMATEAELANLRSLSGTAFDVEFLQLMIRHHQGGFDMASYAAEHAEERAVQELARSIEQSQGAETVTMTRMLTGRGGTPLPAP